jgi:glycosyltransferase A (GT-A) superfamily protein (DUF2064 family)
MTAANRTLVIMAKAPRLGSVKTRLAGSLSLQAVTELYQCLLNDTISLTQALDPAEIAIMCPASDVDDLSRAMAKTVPIVPQTGPGLAAGLASVFNHFATSGLQLLATSGSLPSTATARTCRHLYSRPRSTYSKPATSL